MDSVTLEWAGKRRAFRLTFGAILDLEAACGDVGIGALFVRVSNGTFSVKEVFETIRIGLIHGGATVTEADQLMRRHFDSIPILHSQVVANEIIVAAMAGVEPIEGDGPGAGDAEKPHSFSTFAGLCEVFGMSPEELRACRYSDILNLIKGYAAARDSKDVPAPPTEAEFDAILDRYEPKD